MRVLELWAENVRGISTRKTIKPSPSGVTLIHAPNESGKTTLSEVLTFLFSFPTASSHTSIKSLQPVGKDVGPAMGATLEIGPDTYVIKKQWLKEKKTEVIITGSRNLQLAGPEAQREIEKIFADSLDSTFWDLLQLQQAEFNSLVDIEYDKNFLKALENLLDKLHTDSDEENADSLFETVEKEYSRWFTANGRATTAAGTKGRELSEIESDIKIRRAEEKDLKRKIEESAEVEQAVKKEKVDIEQLKKTYKAQQLNKEIAPLLSEIAQRTNARKAIEDIRASSPLLETFSAEKFLELQDLFQLELQYSALNSITLTAISENQVQLQGESTKLDKGESREIPLELGLKIVIPEILEISYGSVDHESPNLAQAHRKFIALLADLGVEDWSSAQKLARAHSDLNFACKKLEDLTSTRSLESIQEELQPLQAKASEFANWAELLAAPSVKYEELDSLAQEDAVARGRWIEINKNGWDEKYNETVSHLQSLEAQEKRLRLQRDAIKKLYEILITNREKSARDVAPLFAKKLNEIAMAFFGDGVNFHVTDEFAIQSRHKDGANVPIAQLSTGAKEQLAILIRLTLSRLVQLGSERKEGVPVIFDDEFGHTDPQRLKEMASLIKGMGDEQQFIFMTCYPDKFKDFSVAKKIDLLA